MSDYDIADRKSIARDRATDDPDHIGRDATGADHFWSVYDRTVIVVAESGVDTCDMPDIERPLAEWRDYTDAQRGWQFHAITDAPLLEAI